MEDLRVLLGNGCKVSLVLAVEGGNPRDLIFGVQSSGNRNSGSHLWLVIEGVKGSVVRASDGASVSCSALAWNWSVRRKGDRASSDRQGVSGQNASNEREECKGVHSEGRCR